MPLATAHAIAGGVAIAFIILAVLAALAAYFSIKADIAALFLIAAGWCITSLIVFIVAGCIWLTTFPH